MVIDAHTHIYPDAVATKAISTVVENGNGTVRSYTDGTYSGLISSMDRAGINVSIVLPVATNPFHGRSILQWITANTGISSRIIFFGSVHPDDPDLKNTIIDMKSAGIQGIKLHPGYQDFPADSAKAFRLYDMATENGLILHFHSGFDPSLPHCDYTSVQRFRNVISRFPGGRIVLAHAGGMNQWQEVMDQLGNRGVLF